MIKPLLILLSTFVVGLAAGKVYPELETLSTFDSVLLVLVFYMFSIIFVSWLYRLFGK